MLIFAIQIGACPSLSVLDELTSWGPNITWSSDVLSTVASYIPPNGSMTAQSRSAKKKREPTKIQAQVATLKPKKSCIGPITSIHFSSGSDSQGRCVKDLGSNFPLMEKKIGSDHGICRMVHATSQTALYAGTAPRAQTGAKQAMPSTVQSESISRTETMAENARPFACSDRS
ncbi:hypothetical protein SCAR479_04520 [Seiridium cardinale]|uniref:Uncharacterized protein n=1 Tax=Seiridium cardinale TaxID=138064 RepID=A0ABR2XXG6_9PEZI